MTPHSDLFIPQNLRNQPRGQSSSLWTPEYPDEFLKMFEPGYETNPLLAPTDIPVRKKFDPLVLFFIGRRGDGKSLSMVSLANYQKKRYAKSRSPYKIWSNFQIDFSDFSNPRLLDFMLEYPYKCSQKLICIDEIASAFPGRRSMAAINVQFSNFLTQIRKLRSECMFATQFPQVVDVQILLQVDLFIRCRSMMGGKAVRLQIYDWWGQFTGDDNRKPWPPQPDSHDWELILYNTNSMWGTYDTYEIVAPVNAENRDDIISHFYEEFDDPEAVQEKGSVLDDVAAPPADLDEYLAGLPKTVSLGRVWRTAKKLDPTIVTRQDFRDRLMESGEWEIRTTEGSQALATRKG